MEQNNFNRNTPFIVKNGSVQTRYNYEDAILQGQTTGIYKITNTVNGKTYIGSSIDIPRRWREHGKRYEKEQGKWLYQAFSKYGLEMFEFEIIEECDEENLAEREEFWILETASFPAGYNMTPSGTRGGGYFILTPLTLEALIHDLKETSDGYYTLSEKYGIGESSIASINTGKTYYNKDIDYPIRKTYQKKEPKYCLDCNERVSSESIRCKSCQIEYSRRERPNKETLIQSVKEKGLSGTAERYSISYVSLVKWLKFYDIPHTFNSFIDKYGSIGEKTEKKTFNFSEERFIYMDFEFLTLINTSKNEVHYFSDIASVITFLKERNLTVAGDTEVRKSIGRAIRKERKTYLGYEISREVTKYKLPIPKMEKNELGHYVNFTLFLKGKKMFFENTSQVCDLISEEEPLLSRKATLKGVSDILRGDKISYKGYTLFPLEQMRLKLKENEIQKRTYSRERAD